MPSLSRCAESERTRTPGWQVGLPPVTGESQPEAHWLTRTGGRLTGTAGPRPGLSEPEPVGAAALLGPLRRPTDGEPGDTPSGTGTRKRERYSGVIHAGHH
jgi:hypothetical protein